MQHYEQVLKEVNDFENSLLDNKIESDKISLINELSTTFLKNYTPKSIERQSEEKLSHFFPKAKIPFIQSEESSLEKVENVEQIING